MPEKPDDLDQPTSFRPWWQRPSGAALIALAVLTVLTFTCCLSPISWIKGDTDIFGNYKFLKERQQAEQALEGMELVHARLFPLWLIELANAPQPERADAESFAPLRKAVEHDEMLVGILDKIHAILVSDTVHEKDGELLQLRWAWNRRLTELDEPFYLQADLISINQNTFWVAEFYRTLTKTVVSAAEIPVDILIVERIDSSNSFEMYTGLAHAGATEAIVLVNRTFDTVVEKLWPLLDAENSPDETPEVEGSIESVMLPYVLTEMRQALAPEHVERLIATAPLRREIAEITHDLINRKGCERSVRLPQASWDGYNPLTLDRLSAWAKMDRLESCPRATYKEADRLREISRTLQRDKPLKDALESMLAWLTRSTTIHEARHIADDQLVNGLEAPLDCELCPASMSTSARAELSAYLASFAWNDASNTSLFLACMNNQTGRGPHRTALSVALRHLKTLCGEPPPADLAARARDVEDALFGRRQPIVLPENYPKSVTIQYH